jgi:hypothetical protein
MSSSGPSFPLADPRRLPSLLTVKDVSHEGHFAGIVP